MEKNFIFATTEADLEDEKLEEEKKRLRAEFPMAAELLFPEIQDFIKEVLAAAKAEHEKLMEDPQYKEIWEELERQEKDAEELIRSGNLMDPEWIREHIDIITDDEAVKNEVYQWLNDYVKTPEGQANLARALVNEEGAHDNKMEIEFGTTESLNGAGGWANAGASHVQLSLDSRKENMGKWVKDRALPHEVRHVGQQEIPDLSPREYALYQGLIIEADARLTEFSDGISEGRNLEHEGYRGLQEDFEAVLKDLKLDTLLLGENIETWEDFYQLKETNRPFYNRILGRIKEREFIETLNYLGRTPLYQEQADFDRTSKGSGNLLGLRSWCKEMCVRHGMRFNVVWPEIEAMATGRKEIPGMEGCFDKEGNLTEFARRIQSNLQREIDIGWANFEVVRDSNGAIQSGCAVSSNGDVTKGAYDKWGRTVMEAPCEGKYVRWRRDRDEHGNLRVAFQHSDGKWNEDVGDTFTGSFERSDGTIEYFVNGKLDHVEIDGKVYTETWSGDSVSRYDEAGNLVYSASCKDDYKNETWYWPNGNPKQGLVFKGGQEVQRREYYENGQQMIIQTPQSFYYFRENGELAEARLNKTDGRYFDFEFDSNKVRRMRVCDEKGETLVCDDYQDGILISHYARVNGEIVYATKEELAQMQQTKAQDVQTILNNIGLKFFPQQQNKTDFSSQEKQMSKPYLGQYPGGMDDALAAACVSHEDRQLLGAARSRAARSAAKPYFGRRPGGIDDAIAFGDQKTRTQNRPTRKRK